MGVALYPLFPPPLSFTYRTGWQDTTRTWLSYAVGALLATAAAWWFAGSVAA